MGAIRAVYKFGYLLETPKYPTVLTCASPLNREEGMSSDNPIGADNQQERLGDLHLEEKWSHRILRGHMPNTI